MKIDMKVLRWILLGLYLALVIGSFGLAFAGKLPHWLFPFSVTGKPFWTIFLLVILLGS